MAKSKPVKKKAVKRLPIEPPKQQEPPKKKSKRICV